MIWISSLERLTFAVLAYCCVSFSCGADDPPIDGTEKDFRTMPVSATFGEIANQRAMKWLGDGEYILTGDVVSKVRYCNSDKLLMCISDPYPIFIPKGNGLLHIKIEGINYEVGAASNSLDPTPINVCDAWGVWIKIRNLEEKFDRWYLFTQPEGLVSKIFFAPSDKLEQTPELAYKRTSGKIFPLEKICND